MDKKLIFLAITLSMLTISCGGNADDPSKWVKKFDVSKTERKAALNKLEFIYEVDTTLHEVCSEIMAPKAWDKKAREIVHATKEGPSRKIALELGKKKFNKYNKFCKKYYAGLEKKIPKFRKIVIPAILTALNDKTKDWNTDLMIKLLIKFQNKKKPIKPLDIQKYYIETLKSFGDAKYLTNREKIDARTVVVLRGLKELNKTHPHADTFTVIKGLLKKIYSRPEEFDSISQVRLALVNIILDLRGPKDGPSYAKFSNDAASVLVDIIRRGKHDTADEKYYCQDKPCKQNFLINKKAAVKLGELGIANKDTNFTLVTCLYSVEIGLGRRRKSFRECKVALSKLYKPSLKGTKIDPVGILALLAEGDPSRYPLSYNSKKDKWYAYKDNGKFILYGNNKNQSSRRSTSVTECMKNYDKFRKSEYFKFVTKRRWRALKRFHGRTAKTEKFDDLFSNFVAAHKKRTDMWGEGACKIFVLNNKGGWDKKDSAVVERTAAEALRGMGAGPEIQRIFLDTYSSYAMKAYWDFTAKQSKKAAFVRCKKEGMLPAFIKTNCVPKYNNEIGGIKSQWNKLLDYNWLVDSSKEAMYGAGWLTTEMKSETARRIKAELLKRLRWLHDPRSTVFAAKALAMLPFEKSILDKLLEVAIAKLDKKDEVRESSGLRKGKKKRKVAKKGDKTDTKSKAEPWYIASELLWEQYRQQAIQLIQTGKDAAFCKLITNDKTRKECKKLFNKRFEAVMAIFGQWQYNKDRWLRSRYIWINTIQDFFGFWPIDPKTKKPTQMTPEKRFKEYKKWYETCTAKIKAFSKLKKKKPEDEPICDGYDKSKKWGWNIRASKSAKGMRKAGIGPKEAEKRLIMSGYERIRLDFLSAAFDYANVASFDRLLKLKATDIMQDPGTHPLDRVKRDKLTEASKIDYELMVQRPWDKFMEKLRRKRAEKVITDQLNKLKKPIIQLRTFLSKYRGRSGESDLNNVSTLREIIKTVQIFKDCPEKDAKGRVPSCAVFKDIYDEKTDKWTKKRLPSKKTIVTPWHARRKALMLLNGWDKEINPMDRKELVNVLAETYGKSEVPVRKTILLVLDRWSRGSDYETLSKPIMKVINQETENHRRGGFFWMNQDALSFLGRLKGKK